MTLCTKGMGLSPDPHRRRMPWTAEKECVPGVVHSSKEKMVLDGAQRVDVDYVDRASRVYPLEALRVAVASYEYNTFRGRTFLKRSLRRNPMCSGNGFTARIGRRGCTTRTPTRTAIHFLCHGSNAARANTPCGFSGVKCAVPFAVIFPHSRASVHTPCRLRAHPLIDAADTAAHCWCFLHDCYTAPSSWCSETGDENTADQVQSDGAGSPVSVSLTTTAHPHHRRAQKSTGQGRH
ncbi:hypothetical protein C4B63_62g1 [Trypanosoma cruzi]|uniref:Uncharacterized protein n=1 Tax=Trypanosoma cruzi TaxID=5693 RepID=A0A2V2V464_TRYCR|nr:hypothetical protein C4B63_62g1 [Trypanosoma cruzi]